MKKIVFYVPKYKPSGEVFGCATDGFAGVSADETEEYAFALPVKGIVLNGTYEEILSQIPEGTYKAAIVLFGNAGGENAFTMQLYKKLACPVVGGGAARDGAVGGLIAGGGLATVLLIDDPNYDIIVETCNIHSHILGECRVDFENPRVVKAIDGEDPAKWLKNVKATVGFAETDFEHLTLCDKNGVNAHLSWDGKQIICGRDLEPEMVVRYVKPEEVYPAVYAFYNDTENTIVFGCAGVKAITGEIAPIASLGLYLHGEVCMAGENSVFGNLMLSKIKFVVK